MVQMPGPLCQVLGTRMFIFIMLSVLPDSSLDGCWGTVPRNPPVENKYTR